MIKFLVIGFCVVFGSCFGQTRSSISSKEFRDEMTPVLQQLNQNNIVMRFKKETFPDARSVSPIESINGVIYRGAGLQYKMIAGGITVLQTDELSVYIDSVQKFIQVSEIDSSMKALNMMGSFTEEMLANYDLERTANGNFTILKATPKYFDEGTMEFYIDPKKKVLYKLVICLPPANYFMDHEDDETIESPYVSVIYEPIIPLKKNEMSFSEVSILEKDKQDNVSLTTNMAGYQLHDARYRSKK